MFMINIELEQLLGLEGSVKAAAERTMALAAQSLAAATHGHIVEQVQSKLHSTRQKYLDALSFKQLNKDTWIISLGPEAMFLEEGMQRHEMIDDLLGQGRGPHKGSPAKTAKDGSKYRVIPFEHKKGPTAQTQKAKSLTDIIKGTMKQLNIPYGKLEMNAAGKPKVGLLHSFDVLKKPNSMGGGDVERGKHSGISLLQGVRVYQKPVAGPGGTSSVKRQIMTFRAVSSKHKGTGRWVHPGLQPRLFMDEGYRWALEQWSQKIAPEILKQFNV